MSILVDSPEPGVARVLINRPAKRNAIDFDVREQMYHALLEIKADTSNRALVLGGVDGIFSAGGDLDSMGGLDESNARARMQHIHRLCLLIAHFPMPVITAVEGFCAGAAVGMSLLGDYIVVGNKTKIIFPFMGLGLVPDWGAMLTLPRRIGVGHARRLMNAGKIVTGEEACQLGFADLDVGNADVMLAAIDQARQMTRLPQSAYACFKERLMLPSASIEQELQREEDDQVVLLQGPEFERGYAAATTKQQADFLTVPRETLNEQ